MTRPAGENPDVPLDGRSDVFAWLAHERQTRAGDIRLSDTHQLQVRPTVQTEQRHGFFLLVLQNDADGVGTGGIDLQAVLHGLPESREEVTFQQPKHLDELAGSVAAEFRFQAATQPARPVYYHFTSRRDALTKGARNRDYTAPGGPKHTGRPQFSRGFA